MSATRNHRSRGSAKTVVVTVTLAVIATLLSATAAYASVPRPTLVSPKGSTVGANPVLKWKPVRGAVSYQVQLAQGGSFGTILFDERTDNTRAVPTKQLPIGKLSWRVRAYKDSGAASRWSSASFTRSQLAGPTLLAPADGATLSQPSNPPLLRWNPVAGALSYEIELDGPEEDWVDTTTYTTRISSLVIPDPQAPGTFAWRVRALLDSGLSTKPSAARTYDVAPLPVVGPATPNSTVTPVTDVVFDWDPVPGAISYDIRVSSDDSFNTIVDSKVVQGTRYSPPTTYNNANYWWQVRPRNIFGQAQDWDGVEIRVFRRAWPDTASLVYPAAGASITGELYFQWTPAKQAARYRLDVGTDPNFSASKFYDTCYTTETTYTSGYAKTPSDPCMPSKAATFYWRVQALDDPKAVNGVLSAVGSFTYTPVAAPAPGSPLGLVTGQRIALNGSGLESGACASASCDDMMATPVLDWSPVSGAASYRIYLSHDPELTNLVYGNKADPDSLPRTTSTMWTPVDALDESQAGDAYYWYIRPCDSSGLCGVDPTQATYSFRKKSPEVQRVSPADGATVANDVTFTWTDYLTTNAASTNTATGEHPTQAARSYHVQVSTSPAFTSLVDDAVVDQTTYTAYDQTYPEGTLYWRIQAVDGMKNGLSWSAPWTFVKQSPTVSGTNPADGARVSGTQPFTWPELDFAGSYQVEVYKNGDTNASSANRVLSFTSKQTSYSPTSALQTSSRPYVWRIRRLDSDRRVGAWGSWRTFTVTGARPKLISPRSGGRVSKRNALFTWRAMSGASYYVVALRKGGSIEDTETTVATAYAPFSALDRGKWQWRVTSYDSSKHVIKSSAWRKFTAR